MHQQRVYHHTVDLRGFLKAGRSPDIDGHDSTAGGDSIGFLMQVRTLRNTIAKQI